MRPRPRETTLLLPPSRCESRESICERSNQPLYSKSSSAIESRRITTNWPVASASASARPSSRPALSRDMTDCYDNPVLSSRNSLATDIPDRPKGFAFYFVILSSFAPFAGSPSILSCAVAGHQVRGWPKWQALSQANLCPGCLLPRGRLHAT